MRTYCRAYQLGDLRQFSGWRERPVPVATTSQAADQAKSDAPLTDDDICYLWDDFVVVSSPFQEASILFDAVTPEWQDFCRTTLGFAIPEDLRYAYADADAAQPSFDEATGEAAGTAEA